MSAVPPTPKNKNRWLVTFREWHSWGGLFLSAFILLVAVTGILLNHKHTFFPGEGHSKAPAGLLSTTTSIAALPIGFEAALERARAHYGDVPLEKIELKDERGRLIYKVARGGGEEIRIDAQTGAMASKYGLSLDPDRPSSIHWAKLVDDLHTGKIFGLLGKLTIDVTSGVLIALTLTGIYLWAVPWQRKRQSRKRQAENTPVTPPVTSSERLQRLTAAKRAALEPEPVGGEPD